MRMRAVRSLVAACVSVVGCLVILSTLTNTTPASPAALHTLVTHTHNHLNHLHNNIKEEFESFVSVPDPEVLHKLGFVDEPVLYPHTNWTNLTTPVIATAVSDEEVADVAGVVQLAGQVSAGATLLVYTLDLSYKQMAEVESVCNDTCSVVVFDYSPYPSHVRNWKLRAYRPIIIQELLVRAAAVLWLDPSIRLVNPSSSDPSASYAFDLNSSDRRTHSGDGTGDWSDQLIVRQQQDNHQQAHNQQQQHVYSQEHPDSSSSSSDYVYPKNTGDKSTASSSKSKSNGYKSNSSRLSLQSHIRNSVLNRGNQEGNSNATTGAGSHIQMLYPADQAALLQLENRFVDVSKSDANESDDQAASSATVVAAALHHSKPDSLDQRREETASKKFFYYTGASQKVFANDYSGRLKRNLGLKELTAEENTYVETESYPINEEVKQTHSFGHNNSGQVNTSNLIPIVKPFDELKNVAGENLSLSGSSSINSNNTRGSNNNIGEGSDGKNNKGDSNSYVINDDNSKSKISNIDKDSTIIEDGKGSINNEDTIEFLSPLEAEQASESDECLLESWGKTALQQRGVAAWQLSDPLIGHLPTAALTHPGMFAAMHTAKNLYDFHQMTEAGAILLYNTADVHLQLMKPWLSCSLSLHCIQPIGSQDTGCRYEKKPLFRYSGCHLYDTSAFNVALGLMFGPDNHPYQLSSPPTFTRTPPVTSTPNHQAPAGVVMAGSVGAHTHSARYQSSHSYASSSDLRAMSQRAGGTVAAMGVAGSSGGGFPSAVVVNQDSNLAELQLSNTIGNTAEHMYDINADAAASKGVPRSYVSGSSKTDDVIK